MQKQPLWMRKRVYLLSWSRFEEVSTMLKQKVEESKLFPFDILICVARGGLVPGVKFSHLFSIPQLGFIYLRRNETSELYSSRQSPTIEGYYFPELSGKKVLIVDDIVGSGDTLQLAVTFVSGFQPSCVQTLSVVVNKGTSSYPDFYSVEVDDWVIFPWESVLQAKSACEISGLEIVEI